MQSGIDSRGVTPQDQSHDVLDNYFLDDDFEDPVASPPRNATADASRRNQPGGLGIDEEVSVQKRARVPRVKLDETRLLSENGIPKLRKRARNLWLKGKGHEFSDATRLLSFYQLWLDDLFPKAKFSDALAMVEKAGHKTSMHRARMDWINEGRPRLIETEESASREVASSGPSGPLDVDAMHRSTPSVSQQKSRPPTIRSTIVQGAWTGSGQLYGDDEPDEEALDEIIAETESQAAPGAVNTMNRVIGRATGMSGPGHERATIAMGNPEAEDLDTLIAEAEANGGSTFSVSADLARDSPAGGAPQAEEDTLNTTLANPQAAIYDGPGLTGVSAEEEEAMAEMEGLW